MTIGMSNSLGEEQYYLNCQDSPAACYVRVLRIDCILLRIPVVSPGADTF